MRNGQPQREVLFITGANPLRGGGGLETYVRAHGLAARAAGFAPHIFCLGPETQLTAVDFGMVHQVSIQRKTVRGALAAAYSPLFVRALREHVARSDGGQPVLIHAFGGYGFLGARLARVLERQGVHTVQVTSVYNTLEHEHRAFMSGIRRQHGTANAMRYLGRYAWVRALGTRTERNGYQSSRLLLVNYESVRALLVTQFGAPAEIRSFPYASDTAFDGNFDRFGSEPGPIAALRPAGAPLIVSTSRHDARKGVDVLLRALGALHAAGVQFRACLLGRGELIAANRRLARRLGLEQNVAITGQVPNVVPYVRRADIYVLPSRSESSGSVSLLEALQAGVAIVASGCDGIPEDVSDGDSALVVAPGDERALAGAIARLLGDALLRRQLGERARELYEARFSADRFTTSLAALYAELGVYA
jgi:glycosyltransferase involved in cell wall biosynthesis